MSGELGDLQSFCEWFREATKRGPLKVWWDAINDASEWRAHDTPREGVPIDYLKITRDICG